jgi:hypothetical protein
LDCSEVVGIARIWDAKRLRERAMGVRVSIVLVLVMMILNARLASSMLEYGRPGVKKRGRKA